MRKLTLCIVIVALICVGANAQIQPPKAVYIGGGAFFPVNVDRIILPSLGGAFSVDLFQKDPLSFHLGFMYWIGQTEEIKVGTFSSTVSWNPLRMWGVTMKMRYNYSITEQWHFYTGPGLHFSSYSAGETIKNETTDTRLEVYEQRREKNLETLELALDGTVGLEYYLVSGLGFYLEGGFSIREKVNTARSLFGVIIPLELMGIHPARDSNPGPGF